MWLTHAGYHVAFVCAAPGKTTLLKLLVGELAPTDGHVVRNGKMRIAHFTQYHVDQLDLTMVQQHKHQHYSKQHLLTRGVHFPAVSAGVLAQHLRRLQA